MSSLLMRPGATLGDYPERPAADENPLEHWLRQTLEQLAHLPRTRSPYLRRVVSQINEHARGLTQTDDTQLVQTISELRRQLHKQGLEQALVQRAFALIREMAARTLGMRHYDSQLMGGWVMVNGMLAEMETGEGKTLTATLPAAAAALAGIPVHVITVNDYLASRDSRLMAPLYRALGLSVGTITEELDFEARRSAYACDITYCTNKQLTFDYLRDRIAQGNGPRRGQRDGLLLRGLCFAIVDEADSVLIDEARTPLVITRPGSQQDMEITYGQALELARKLVAGRHYTMNPREQRIALTEEGKTFHEELATRLPGIWRGPRRRSLLVTQALSALHCFLRDRHYLVRDDKVQIIDEHTGRIMADRSWEQGLHQLIELKEGCPLTGTRETLARISYQRFFRRYLRLCGMTGTAREVRGELATVYGLHLVDIPTHKPSQRQGAPDRLYPSSALKWQAVVERIKALHQQGRPVLAGTRSVEDSEHLSQLLHRSGLPHQVLNARQDAGEAAIVARAGEAGCITVATNMAGRGTDIPLAPGVAQRGGLHVIATQRNEAARIDRQLFGRCARQGDAGSYEFYLSLDDELVQQQLPAFLRRLLEKARHGDAAMPAWTAWLATRLPQKFIERRHRLMRRAMLETDDRLADFLAFSGRGE